MAENNIREKIEDKMVPVLSSEENVFRLNSKIKVNDEVYMENNDHVKEIVDFYENKIKSLKDKLELIIEIKDELIRGSENKNRGSKNYNLNDHDCKETKDKDKEVNYLNPSVYPVEYSSYTNISMKRSNNKFKSNKSSLI